MEAFIKIGAKIVLSLFILGTILSVGACSSLEKGISLKNEISGIKIPDELKIFEKDLINAHNLK